MTQTHYEIADVDSRLADLGLNEALLAEVVRQGYVAFISCSPNDPPFFPGFSAWASMVRSLREYLLPAWERSDDNNYSLVVNVAGTVAIAVATGDEATGRRGETPTTKSSKGPSTSGAVNLNQMQLALTIEGTTVPTVSTSDHDAAPRMTWILLVHRAANEVRCELSLPSSMGADGRVDRWEERIILKAIPTDPAFMEITPPPQLPDITIDVKRRA
jgi:hypothetical protein